MIRKKKRKYDKEDLEQVVVDGYMQLVEAVLINALEKLAVPKGWKKISRTALEKKAKDVNEIQAWLKTPGSQTWFYFYEIATGIDSGRVRRRFRGVLISSKKRLKKLSTARLLTRK